MPYFFSIFNWAWRLCTIRRKAYLFQLIKFIKPNLIAGILRPVGCVIKKGNENFSNGLNTRWRLRRAYGYLVELIAVGFLYLDDIRYF